MRSLHPESLETTPAKKCSASIVAGLDKLPNAAEYMGGSAFGSSNCTSIAHREGPSDTVFHERAVDDLLMRCWPRAIATCSDDCFNTPDGTLTT